MYQNAFTPICYSCFYLIEAIVSTNMKLYFVSISEASMNEVKTVV